MVEYYDGEQTSAYVVGSLGGVAAIGGALLATHSTTFDRSLGWTWIVLGGLEAIGAGSYALQVDHEIDHYTDVLTAQPPRYRAEEIAHIRGVRSRFIAYRIAELSLVVGGGAMAAYGFASASDAWKGVGIGIASLSLPIAVIDTINNARARRYLSSLERGAQVVGVAPADHGLALVLGGRF